MKKITLFTLLITTLTSFAQDVIITGYMDSACPGASGRTLELYVDGTIDFTGYAIQRQSNGGGYTSTIDIATLGIISDSFVYLTNDETILASEFNITTNVLQSGSINSNGDDAFQVVDAMMNVIDRFGEDMVDGTGTAWEHVDSFYLRNSGQTSNGGAFNASNWTFGAQDALDNQGLCNMGAALSTLVSFGSFTPAVTLPTLEITEIFPGQAGADLTEDWFEITNTGSIAYDAAIHGALHYDDDSADATTADVINGITTLAPGATALVVITANQADVTTFMDVWGAVIDLTGIAIGNTDGSGLGGGGDAVTLWIGDPLMSMPAASGSYPDTSLNDGQSYDVDLMAFSTVANANGAVATTALGGDAGDIPNIGSPGNGDPVSVAQVQFMGSFNSVIENENSISVTVTISETPINPVTVDVVLLPVGTATEGVNFNYPATQTVTFAAGSDMDQTINIPILDNATDDADTFFILTLNNVNNATVGATDTFGVYILDEDSLVPQGDVTPLNASYLTSYLIEQDGTAEIVAYDAINQQLFVVNDSKINVLDFSDPNNITENAVVDITSLGASAQSVAVYDDLIAIAIANENETEPGFIVFSDTLGNSDPVIVQAGVLPDMVVFSPDGTKVLVANEGQPNGDYSIDPEGTVSIIDVTGGLSAIDQGDVTTVTFTSFNGQEAALNAAGIRVYGPSASAAQDFEPEYITVSNDSQKAYVSLQENNAYVVIDIATATVEDIFSFGLKDHSLPQNSLDTSDETNFIFNASWPIRGMYMPDAISFYNVNGVDYIVTANEGDAREYNGFEEEVKLGDAGYELDPAVFNNPEILALESNLGEITISNASGDLNGDGLYEEIHVFGGRSFSIFEAATGTLVYDSANDFEVITAADPVYGAIFNASNSNNNPKNRSDNKGPEPEGVLVQEINGSFYAFILLERIGGVMIYDITDPVNPQYLQYLNNRDTVPGGDEMGDLGPEGITFISAEDSPTGVAYIVIANEVSATLSVYALNNVILNNTDFSENTTAFAMYPNPANGAVFFSKPNDYRIYDILGRQILEVKNASSINVGNLQQGTYVVINAQGQSSKLLVK